MNGKWISIERPPCACAFAVSVASWATAVARAMDSPRPWWSSKRAVKSLQGLEQAVDLLRRDHRPVFAMETMALSPWTRVRSPLGRPARCSARRCPARWRRAVRPVSGRAPLGRARSHQSVVQALAKRNCLSSEPLNAEDSNYDGIRASIAVAEGDRHHQFDVRCAWLYILFVRCPAGMSTGLVCATPALPPLADSGLALGHGHSLTRLLIRWSPTHP